MGAAVSLVAALLPLSLRFGGRSIWPPPYLQWCRPIWRREAPPEASRIRPCGVSPLEAAPLALALRLWLLSCDSSEATPRKQSIVCGLLAAAPQLGPLGGEPLARPLCGSPSAAMPQSLCTRHQPLGLCPSASDPRPQPLGPSPSASGPRLQPLSGDPSALAPWLPNLGFWPLAPDPWLLALGLQSESLASAPLQAPSAADPRRWCRGTET